MSNVVKLPGPPAPPRCAVPIGQTSYGPLELDLARVLAGRMLVEGGSGAEKSQTMRRIVEEAFDYVQTMIVDPEGEFGNLVAHIGATTIKVCMLGLRRHSTRPWSELEDHELIQIHGQEPAATIAARVGPSCGAGLYPAYDP